MAAWTNSPPPVTLTTTLDGAVFPRFLSELDVEASVPNAANVARVEFFAGSQRLGSVTNAPYVLRWQNPGEAAYVIVAQVTDLQGRVTQSRPARIVVGVDAYVWGGRFLPTGQFVLFYSAGMFGRNGVYGSSRFDWLLFWSSYRGLCNAFGVFVDESLPDVRAERRFYEILPSS